MMPGSNPQWEMLEPAALVVAVQQLEPVECATEDCSSCATSTHDGSTSAATPELAEERTSGLRLPAPAGHRERRSEELEPVARTTSVAPMGNTMYGPPLSYSSAEEETLSSGFGSDADTNDYRSLHNPHCGCEGCNRAAGERWTRGREEHEEAAEKARARRSWRARLPNRQGDLIQQYALRIFEAGDCPVAFCVRHESLLSQLAQHEQQHGFGVSWSMKMRWLIDALHPAVWESL